MRMGFAECLNFTSLPGDFRPHWWSQVSLQKNQKKKPRRSRREMFVDQSA
jgi:hypothetical protein